ncbi:MAG: helix-turn-helix domain-containing protein [Planctomycetia bacterium]|nr:helix-turn-helix domain-containing protein [Planctomycetia bacterium]
MAEHQAIIGLWRLGWSFRRIAAEVGVDRETVSRHVRSVATGPADANAAISITGLPGGAGNESPGAADGDAAHATTYSAAADRASADSNAAISIIGSGRRSGCEPLRAVILAKARTRADGPAHLAGPEGRARLRRRLSVGAAVRPAIAAGPPAALPADGVCPGDEAQVDFGTGALIVIPDGSALPSAPSRGGAGHTSCAWC